MTTCPKSLNFGEIIPKNVFFENLENTFWHTLNKNTDLESGRLYALTLNPWTPRANLYGPHSEAYSIESIVSYVANFGNFNVKCYVIKEFRNKFLLSEIQLHYKQLPRAFQKQLPRAIHFQRFPQKILVVDYSTI